MSRSLLRIFALVGALALVPLRAHAQDATPADDAELSSDAGTGDRPDASAGDAENTGNCQADPAPAGHTVRVETRIEPAQPMIGDRVLITYRLFHNGADTLEFEPDPVAFAQPGIELEYARTQPDRERSVHNAPGGGVYGEISVAVQPFKPGDVVIPEQLARLRAAGEVIRVCTPAVHFRSHDPFGNDAHPRPKDITPPYEVSEDALRMRWISIGLDSAFVLVVSTLFVSAYLRRRPKPVAPPPPPRAPWLVAIEGLDAISSGDLLSRGLTKDYYDAISDVIRRYCGNVRGFDALEMTTDEVLVRVRKTPLSGVAAVELEHLLRECDLVKFARYIPPHEESDKILKDAYGIVRRSTPAQPSGTYTETSRGA